MEEPTPSVSPAGCHLPRRGRLDARFRCQKAPVLAPSPSELAGAAEGLAERSARLREFFGCLRDAGDRQYVVNKHNVQILPFGQDDMDSVCCHPERSGMPSEAKDLYTMSTDNVMPIPQLSVKNLKIHILEQLAGAPLRWKVHSCARPGTNRIIVPGRRRGGLSTATTPLQLHTN